MVIAGPNRGSSYGFQDGEVSIGRQAGNTIILSSENVSKKHCVLVVNNEDVMLRDQNSSNGTFVNGVFTRAKNLKAGDRIGIGEYILELVQPQSSRLESPPAIYGMSNVIQFPDKISKTNKDGSSFSQNETEERMPTGPLEKALWFFDKQIMPGFYGLNFKHDLKIMCIWIFAFLCVGSLLISVQPILEGNTNNVLRELGKRARFIARQMVERNTTALATRTEASIDLGSLEKEPDVRLAVLIDLDSRILAPSSKLNQYLTSGEESKIALIAKNKFNQGDEKGFALEPNSSLVVAVEPVKIFNPKLNKNIVIGMALVSLDTTLSVLSLGEIGVVYSKAFILNGLLMLFVFLILYHICLKPMMVLNDDIDKVLKGDMNQVTKEFKVSELNSLWDNINAALHRVPKALGGVGDSNSFLNTNQGPSTEDLLTTFELLGNFEKFGLVVCDPEKKILYMNASFEEISGLRLENIKGQVLSAVSRDQAFSSLCSELFSKVSSGGPPLTEDFEFSGLFYKIHIAALGPLGGPPKCYWFVTDKKGE